MKLDLRDWRIVAAHRGLDDCASRGEFRRCLVEQLSDNEYEEYRGQRLILWGSVLGSFVLLSTFVFWGVAILVSGGLWFYLSSMYDPVLNAQREYNRERELEVRAINRKERQKRCAEGR